MNNAALGHRFWSKVVVDDENSCWEWKAAIFKDTGYGAFRDGHKTITSHRASWIIANGPVPDGMCVLHRCDNRKCVNPFHLFLGTIKDNNDDMIAKKRDKKSFGENHPRAVLSNENVAEIREMFSTGNYGCRELGRIYGVRHSTISGIVNRNRRRSG